MKPPTKPLTLNKMFTKLYQLGTFHSKKREIKVILKNDLKYSFKRGLSIMFEHVPPAGPSAGGTCWNLLHVSPTHVPPTLIR